MAPSKPSFLDPFVLAKIAGLQLRAKTVVEGLVSGLHQSPYRGHSLEFAQHREYAVGDELKHIDWKVYGRTDRFFVKQFEEETNLRLCLLLDGSASMSFKGRKSALTKYEYGAILAASLAYITLRQQDMVGLSCFRKDEEKTIPPGNSRRHLTVLLEALENFSPAGETALAQSIESIALTGRKRSYIILISDLLDESETVLKALKFLRFRKNEVSVLHLLDRDEQDFPYEGLVRFDSLENEGNVVLDAGAYRRDYQFCTTDQPPDRVLRQMLGGAQGSPRKE